MLAFVMNRKFLYCRIQPRRWGRENAWERLVARFDLRMSAETRHL